MSGNKPGMGDLNRELEIRATLERLAEEAPRFSNIVVEVANPGKAILPQPQQQAKDRPIAGPAIRAVGRALKQSAQEEIEAARQIIQGIGNAAGDAMEQQKNTIGGAIGGSMGSAIINTPARPGNPPRGSKGQNGR